MGIRMVKCDILSWKRWVITLNFYLLHIFGDRYLMNDILELKKVDEYIEYEKKTLGLNAFSKPVLFMAKWSGEVLKKIIENIFRENFTAHGSKDLQDKISELEADVTARDLKLDQRTQVRVCKARHIILYFKGENALRNATGGSWRCEDYGIGLQVRMPPQEIMVVRWIGNKYSNFSVASTLFYYTAILIWRDLVFINVS
uniref:Uncharacterized protein n=1 Tax=Rhizophagus irregularis (strain DAOM 181602 / DAOM 197198 / MUCL 43194) TaxID=747089 RepID=U9T1Q6_RHIID